MFSGGPPRRAGSGPDRSGSSTDTPEFALYQPELDAAFHARDDPFPAGTPEHAECLAFVAKLHRVRSSRWAVSRLYPPLASCLPHPNLPDLRN